MGDVLLDPGILQVARASSARDNDDTYLINAAICVYADDLGLGYRFITDDLVHAGVAASETRSKPLTPSHQTGRAI